MDSPTQALTCTPAEAMALTLPATVELLAGWVGPVMVLQDPKHWTYAGLRRGEHYIVPPTWEQHDMVVGDDGLRIESVRLPLSHPEVRAHLVDRLAAGVRCPDCSWAARARGALDGTIVYCSDCRSAGYLRPSADLRWALHYPGLGPEEWVSAFVLWVSWVRMAAGMGPITAVYRQMPEPEAWAPRSTPGPWPPAGFRLVAGPAVMHFRVETLPANAALLDITGPVIRAMVPE